MDKLEQYIDVEESVRKKIPLPCRFIIPQYEIIQYFSQIQSKNEVIEGFLDLGSQCFENLAVFSVFSRAIQFLKGTGENIREQQYVGSYSIDRNTVIRSVVVNKYLYKGAVPVGKDEKEVFGKYFKKYAEEVYLYPGSIRDVETDILFYADSFQKERDSSIITFEYIVEKTILALKYLWIQKELTSI